MLVAGLYDGEVAVYNLQSKDVNPVYKSSSSLGKHVDPTWHVSWQKDDLDDNMNFASVSSDGKVKQWVLMKNELICNVYLEPIYF
jgi:dynein intermediate chain 1